MKLAYRSPRLWKRGGWFLQTPSGRWHRVLPVPQWVVL